VIVAGLGFDFTNGVHDTANYVATWVGTRALAPRTAVAVSATANLAGAFVTTAVAKTVGKGIIDTGLATNKTVLAALIGATVWNLVTWRLGLPSSSTHALIGGLVGAALVQSGTHGVLIYRLFSWLTPGVANRSFRYGQLVSGTWVAFTHGANDAQKTMGVIALALYTNGNISHFYIPVWVKVAAGLTIAAGTYAGGWRIIRTLGQRIYKLQPEHGFAAQLAAGSTLYVGTHFGFPISTTHVVTGSVMGAGATRRFSAVKWGVAGNIVVAWLLTLPAAALVAAALYYPAHALF
jgi:PiT family inorganic phosphate transporter